MLKPIQISAKAPIMPSMRVSTSVALSSRRMAGSFGAALAAPDAAEVMAPPDPAPRRQEERRLDRKAAPRLKTARPCFVSLPDEGATQPQNLTVPGFTPAQTWRLVIHPLSTITL